MAQDAASAPASNEIPIEAWNTILYEKFVRFRSILERGLAVHSIALLNREPFARGARVLDIGVGFGDTTQQIAGQVGPEGAAFGVDCAANFIAAATKEAQAAGLRNTNFFVADVQSDDLRGPYDALFSRFGTMFFNLPGAAMRNMRRALKPGGTLTMIVWRKREDNPWVFEAETAVKAIVPAVSHEDTDQVHCGPGPFSMAGPDMVSDMLKAAGYTEISFERFDTPIGIGTSIEHAIDFAMALGPAGEIMRLAGAEGERAKPKLIDALHKVFAPYQRADGSVWTDSSSWIIRAKNPA
jgi:ubiquinone/menaquinone biosynthesis C-methylase UbiE